MTLLKTFAALPAFRFTAAAILGLSVPLTAFLLPPATTQPPVRIPSYVAWTDDTIAAATSGDAVRGLVIARRCEHCHGREGFSPEPQAPNLAGIDKLVMWKQMRDFRMGKRLSPIMQSVANDLAVRDYADLAAYFALLPTYPDPGDNRSFPQALPPSTPIAAAARLITSGDGKRGIPPCQVCHGPIGHVRGAPSLTTQNNAYIREELEEFAKGARANDINMPMRSIASLLTDEEKQAVAAYYGAGLANLPFSGR